MRSSDNWCSFWIVTPIYTFAYMLIGDNWCGASCTYATSKETIHEAPHQLSPINMYANVYIGVTIQKLHQLSDDRITRETLSNNNPCPSSPSSTILRSAYMALNTLQQDWLL